ncbi:unnamed protein product [Lymnaea stagnalis]|uniref:2-phosphoxylose phosphatase 1 n=1 Tax=Lymnaea stagnalis TaxID=6523 RepID=A0AAV2IN58_LYMST
MYPSHPVCADGQLTGRGAVQQILNGMHCSERYYHQHKLFDEENWSQKVVAHSTEISRTYQSAVAFLYGLLPTFDHEKISINRASNINFCEENIVGGSCSCSSVESLRGKAIRECRADEGYIELLKKHSHLVTHLSDVLGIRPKNIQWTSIMDGLSSFACHNTAPFCNSNHSCVTAKTVEDVWKLVDHQSVCLHNNPHYKKFSKVSSYGLLYRIARELKMAVHTGSNSVFHLYSGHDTTVSPLITALELQDAVWPGYATMIVFELYQKKSSKENFIRILQNGKLVTSEVVFCQGVTTDGFCSLNRFLDYVLSEKINSTCQTINSGEK